MHNTIEVKCLKGPSNREHKNTSKRNLAQTKKNTKESTNLSIKQRGKDTRGYTLIFGGFIFITVKVVVGLVFCRRACPHRKNLLLLTQYFIRRLVDLSVEERAQLLNCMRR